MLNYSKLPGSLVPGMTRYIEHGIQPGRFLTCVLCNNLKESFAQADDYNQVLMFDIVKWIYNEAPMTCWGSPARVKKWIKSFDRDVIERLPK